jgi:hypothetical protein
MSATTLMRFASVMLSLVSAVGQTFEISPVVVQQGQIIELLGTDSASSARMNGRTVRLFKDSNLRRRGLMPIPALEQPGMYTLEFLDDSGLPIHTATITVRDARFPNIRISKGTGELELSPGEIETMGAFRTNSQ